MTRDLKFVLREKLTPQELDSLVKSYDIIGDIAVLRVPEDLKPRIQTIAEAVMQTHRHVKTVLQQAGGVSGEFRLRELEWVAGEKKSETVHREFGCVFKVDLEKSYFSPRLSHERMRVARLVKPGEIVINMFAGVGCYSIVMAKHSKGEKIYSVDVNPFAVQSMIENVRLNRVDARVVPILGDAKLVVAERFRGVADRVLMPLPEKAFEYLDCALSALKSAGGCIHYYDFAHAGKGVNPVEGVEAKVKEKLSSLGVGFDFPLARVVRMTGPYWYQVVVDIHVFGV